MITAVTKKDGTALRTTKAFCKTKLSSCETNVILYSVDEVCFALMEDVGHSHLPLGWRDFLDTPITEEELQAALSKGPCNNVPGKYGICVEFFKIDWFSIKG